MRHTKLALAVAALSAGTAVVPVQAAEIEEVIITSNRLEESLTQDLARYGNQVETITAQQIQQSGFIDVAQALQMLVPGLHIRPKNGQFDYFDASLQGSRTQDILWLIDGVRITNRLYNSTTPLDTIPSHMIERIEVIKGGQGIYYGTQSVSGVINIVTKQLQTEADASASAGYNTNDGYNFNFHFRGGAEQLQYVLYGSKDNADGYQPWRDEDVQPSTKDRNRSYDVNTAGIKLGLTPSENSLFSVHYQRTVNELDFARPYLTVYTVNEREEDIITAKYDLNLNDNVSLYVKGYWHYWDTFYTEMNNTLDDDGIVTGNVITRNDRTFWGYSDRGINAMAKISTNGGVEYIFGYDQQKFSGEDDVWRIAQLEEDVDAYFAQIRTTEDLLENTTLALGVRYNSPKNTEEATVWSLTGKHNFNDNFYLQANVGTSFRLPDAEALFLIELYDDNNDGVPDGFFSVGNPNLRPEESRNFNISVGGTLTNAAWELTYFDRKISDYIESYVPIFIEGVEGESFINTNDEVEIKGAELSANIQFTPEINGTFSYNDTEAELNGDGNQLTGIPESEVKLGIGYEPEAHPWGFLMSVNHVGDINARRGVQRGNYTVMDLSGHLELGNNNQHSLVMRVENLTDKVYATRVDRAFADVSGDSYLYDNLGMERTFHASYTMRF